MRLILRGAVGLGLYLALLLLPLILGSLFRPAGVSRSFLVNLSAALGYLGFTVMALELALVSRVQRASSSFGLDVLQQFHKEIGITALGFVLAHPVLLLVAGYPARILLPSPRVPWGVVLGTVALLLVAGLIGLSVWRKRLRLSYETWQVSHGLLTIALIGLAAVHVASVGRFTRVAPMAVLCACYLLLLLGRFASYRVVMPFRL